MPRLKPRPRVYYGWVIVAAACFVLTLAYSLQFSYGIYLPLMAVEFGWSKAALSAPYAFYIIGYTGLSLVTGRLTDRYGPRLVVIAAGGAMGLGFILLSRTGDVLQLYLALSVVAAIGMSGVFIPLTATVVKWFYSRRAQALSLTGAGVGLAALIGPAVTALLLQMLPWREAMFWSGLGAGALMAAAGCLLKLPQTSPPKSVDAPRVTEKSWSVAEAGRTAAFWQVMAIFSLTWSVLFMPYVHLPAHVLDSGMTHDMAAAVIMALGLGGLAGRLLIGSLVHLTGILPALGLSLVIQIAAYYGLTLCPGGACILLVSVGLGIGSGATTILYTALLAALYGRASIGAISGIIFAVAGLISAIGPYLGGLVRDINGDYNTAFLFGAVINGAAFAVLLTLRRPKAE